MWHFAEGFTASGFDEYLVIFNPGVAGSATITYYVEGAASPTVRTVALATGGRTIVRVHEAMSPSNPGGLGRLNVGHGTTVTARCRWSSSGRSTSPTRDTLAGGHNVLGATAAAPDLALRRGLHRRRLRRVPDHPQPERDRRAGDDHLLPERRAEPDDAA